MVEFDGLKLKELRKSQNLTQAELGLLVQKNSQNIASYENGIGTPPADVLLSLLKHFHLSAADLSKKKSLTNVALL